MDEMKRTAITGKAVAVRGNDIDTDRIMPARFLKCVVFDHLGEHAFEDDRQHEKDKGGMHPFDNPAHAEAEILFVNRNFGCGSSREHAPQGLKRWNLGIKAIVGESFAEIFFGNCVALGMPCVRVDEQAIRKLMDISEKNPRWLCRISLDEMQLTYGDVSVPILLPDGPRKLFLEGRWDSTAELMDAEAEIEALAARLPYFHGWK